MAALNVQFADSSESSIIAYFVSEQSSSQYANLGVVDTSDSRWAKFYNDAGGSFSGLPEPQAATTSTTSAP